MATSSGVEAWVARILEAALPGVAVRVSDDGSRNAMYDLELTRDGRVFAACEITAAADESAIEFWNVANGKGSERWLESDLAGGWLVAARPTARISALRQSLPQILRDLEQVGVEEVYAEWGLSPHALALHELGVAEVHRGKTDFPGSIYLTVELPVDRRGGAVPSNGNNLVRWVGAWLAEPRQRHNIEKVLGAHRDEAHLFVLLPGFTVAPFEAADVLMRPNGPLPCIPPELPSGIDILWLMSTWAAGDVFQWDGVRWGRYHKVVSLP